MLFKKSLLAVMTALLVAALIITSCKGPVGPAGDKGDPGDPSSVPGDTVNNYGTIVLSGTAVSAADLAAAFAESNVRAVINNPGNVILASSVETVYGEVPATRKLIVLRAAGTAVEDGKTLTVAGTLDVAAGASFDGSAITGVGTVVISGTGSATLAAGGQFYAKDAATLTKVSGAGIKAVGLGTGTGGAIAALFGDADTIAITGSVTGLTGADVPVDKTLILRGNGNTLANAALVIAGNLVIPTGGKLATGGSSSSFAGTTGAITVEGTLDIGHTVTLGVIPVLTNGTLELSAAVTATLPAAALSVKDLSIDADVTIAGITGFEVTGVLTATAASKTLTLPAGITAINVGEVDIDDVAFTFAGPTSASVTIGTLKNTDEGSTATLTVPGNGTPTTTTITNVVAGSGTDDVEVAGTAATIVKVDSVSGAGGLTLGANTVLATTGAVTVDSGSKITGAIANFGATKAAAVAQINKVAGGTVVVSDAVTLDTGAAVTFNNTTTTLEFEAAFATESEKNVTFNGPVVFKHNVTVTGAEVLTLLGNSKLLANDKAIAATTGTIVVGGTVNEVANKVTFTKATLTTAGDSAGEIDLNGTTGVVTLGWRGSAAGDKITYANEGTIVTAGLGHVNAGGHLIIGGHASSASNDTGALDTTNGGALAVTATATGAVVIEVKTNHTSILVPSGTPVTTGLLVGTLVDGFTLSYNTDTGSTYKFTKGGANKPVLLQNHAHNLQVPADTTTGGIIELDTKAQIILGTTSGGISFGRQATAVVGGGKLTYANGGLIKVFTDASNSNYKINVGATDGTNTAAGFDIGATDSSGILTLANAGSVYANPGAVGYVTVNKSTAGM
jgi:hypothetical protein